MNLITAFNKYNMYVCVYVCMCKYIYVCVNVYIYINSEIGKFKIFGEF